MLPASTSSPALTISVLRSGGTHASNAFPRAFAAAGVDRFPQVQPAACAISCGVWHALRAGDAEWDICTLPLSAAPPTAASCGVYCALPHHFLALPGCLHRAGTGMGAGIPSFLPQAASAEPSPTLLWYASTCLPQRTLLVLNTLRFAAFSTARFYYLFQFSFALTRCPARAHAAAPPNALLTRLFIPLLHRGAAYYARRIRNRDTAFCSTRASLLGIWVTPCTRGNSPAVLLPLPHTSNISRQAVSRSIYCACAVVLPRANWPV